MTTPEMEAVSDRHEYQQSCESGAPPAANDQLRAAVPMGVARLKARDIEAIVLSSPHGDPMAQWAWSSVWRARNRIRGTA
jgi:hypothetical protein